MNKNKILAGLFTLMLTVGMIVPFVVVQGASPITINQPDIETNADPTGQGSLNFTDTTSAVINYLIGFLGLIALVVVLVGGFKWMTAGGDEKKVKAAKDTLIAGIVGLIIVLSAWVIVRFVLGIGDVIQTDLITP